MTQLAGEVKGEVSVFSLAVSGLQTFVGERLAADTESGEDEPSAEDAPI